MVGITGVEFGAGIVIDLDTPRESGVYINGGWAMGANVGAGVGGGACREIEGWAMGVDVNAGKGSGTLIFDDKGFNGAGVSGGPGAGASVSLTNTTRVLSAGDVVDWIKGWFD